MACHNTMHIPIYEGDEDPERQWFICETIWDTTDITNEAKQMAQFVGGLHKISLTCYMNYI